MDRTPTVPMTDLSAAQAAYNTMQIQTLQHLATSDEAATEQIEADIKGLDAKIAHSLKRCRAEQLPVQVMDEIDQVQTLLGRYRQIRD
jgi:hypothetical protein